VVSGDSASETVGNKIKVIYAACNNGNNIKVGKLSRERLSKVRSREKISLPPPNCGTTNTPQRRPCSWLSSELKK
jgi:hypothetical protein